MGKSGKSGKVNMAEPSDINWVEKLPGCVELFQQVGCMDFFRRLDGMMQRCPVSLLKV